MTVTNFIYGATNHPLAAITREGKWARLLFQAGDQHGLLMDNVSISDPTSGFSTNITFNNGSSWVYITPGSNFWSDWAAGISIKPGRNYEVVLDVGGVGDDDWDFFVGGQDGTLDFYENTGTPTAEAFAAKVDNFAGIDYNESGYCAAAFVDIDADGDQDLFLGGWAAGKIQFWENQSTVSSNIFVLQDDDWLGIRHPLSRPTFCDIDGDGDFDFFCGGQDGTIWFAENIGTASAPAWGPVNQKWKDLQIFSNDWPAETLNYSAPAFGDIDGDGDYDLLVGRYKPGDLKLFENTGSATNPVWGVTNHVYGGIAVTKSSTPALVDIDGDNDLDLFVGRNSGQVNFYRNTGSSTNAIWGQTNLNYLGASSTSWATPAFANINPNLSSVHYEDTGIAGTSTTNGADCTRWLALVQIETGYPEQAIYRSGVFDTGISAPNYRELNWTQIEEFDDGGDLDLRVRSGSDRQMSDANWQDARWADDGYFQSNVGNSLATLPSRRYLQYEAIFRCGFDGKISAHTNEPTAILRNVTIDWDGPTGLVDLRVNFGRGPDCGIVSATVDGQEFIKGVEAEMSIFKEGRTGWNEVNGRMEVRPLNTGR